MSFILLVDDDPMVGAVVKATLMKEGHVVTVLKDGRHAMEVIETEHPDLVILDCLMPFVPGMEVLRQMRASPVGFSIPVMMLTSRSSDSDRAIAMLSGANSYLAKPFSPETLMLRVEKMIYDHSRTI